MTLFVVKVQNAANKVMENNNSSVLKYEELTKNLEKLLKSQTKEDLKPQIEEDKKKVEPQVSLAPQTLSTTPNETELANQLNKIMANKSREEIEHWLKQDEKRDETQLGKLNKDYKAY